MNTHTKYRRHVLLGVLGFVLSLPVQAFAADVPNPAAPQVVVKAPVGEKYQTGIAFARGTYVNGSVYQWDYGWLGADILPNIKERDTPPLRKGDFVRSFLSEVSGIMQEATAKRWELVQVTLPSLFSNSTSADAMLVFKRRID